MGQGKEAGVIGCPLDKGKFLAEERKGIAFAFGGGDKPDIVTDRVHGSRLASILPVFGEEARDAISVLLFGEDVENIGTEDFAADFALRQERKKP